MRRTGIVRDVRFMDHLPGVGHPESPDRLRVIYDMLDGSDMAGAFHEIPTREATEEELLSFHTPRYLERVAATRGRDFVSLDPDTATSPGSYDAALLAAGGLCEAVSRVLEGELDNAFALVRPPGHHAERERAMGFCLFNNVVIAARYAQRSHGIERVLIIDWDLHHGNGTQHAFEDDSTVLYFSTHQFPYYPGTGSAAQTGVGDGLGFTVNIPLSVGHGDGEYMAIFEQVLAPIGRSFDPGLILVSAGFDIYEGDPLGGMRVTPEGFAGLTRSVMDLADASCGGKLVVTLEGGYHLSGLRESVKAVLRELSDQTQCDKQALLSGADPGLTGRVMEQARDSQAPFWRILE
ncbi:MAG: histone deacetylase [Deltaproteobacteria bacterium]|nr:histone deacetylase [Deltaproteobacteria bacterium]MBW1949746.1 histone deacetylase [Deltaproteobacteria bacterium]MBW2007890.1 histone deacetylase [Deltaproteobacteria bacterium]MBW2103687.1 histone deacetylase [Deltaproteobacteria bacterium]MBW2348396.1 histone deacetylase [Deltaproteobacteria bacterium]